MEQTIVSSMNESWIVTMILMQFQSAIQFNGHSATPVEYQNIKWPQTEALLRLAEHPCQSGQSMGITHQFAVVFRPRLSYMFALMRLLFVVSRRAHGFLQRSPCGFVFTVY